VKHVEALIGYCARVRQKVPTFGAAEQRLAFEALNVRVTWTPGKPLAIEGTIPFDEIVPLPLDLRRGAHYGQNTCIHFTLTSCVP
jgi:hypothetical protein